MVSQVVNPDQVMEIHSGLYISLNPFAHGGDKEVYQGWKIRQGPDGQLQQSPVCVKKSRRVAKLLLEGRRHTIFQDVPHALRKRSQLPDGTLVTDFLGPNLAEAIQAHPLPFGKKMSIAKQLLEFLKGAHARKYVHGDIDLANMFFDPDSKILTVFDYGESKQPENIDGATIAQHPNSRTPESLLQMPLGNVTFHLDMWSAGATLFELFTGESLFAPGYTPHHGFIAINQLLHQIFEQLKEDGRPSWSMLGKCNPQLVDELFEENAMGQVGLKRPLRAVEREEWTEIESAYNKFFNESYKKNRALAEIDPDFHAQMERAHQAMLGVYLRQAPWEERVRRSVPEKESWKVLRILGEMLKTDPQARTSPGELLNINGIFTEDIHFHLELPAEISGQSRDQIGFFTQDSVTQNPFESRPVVFIDRAVRIRRNCCHLPKDSQNQYWLLVVRDDERILQQQITIHPGDHVTIVEGVDGKPSVSVTSQDAVIAQVVQSREPFMQGAGASGSSPAITPVVPRGTFASESGVPSSPRRAGPQPGEPSPKRPRKV